jgi:hypothetical protein
MPATISRRQPGTPDASAIACLCAKYRLSSRHDADPDNLRSSGADLHD